MYKAVNPRVCFPEMEENILKFWQDEDIFKKSIKHRQGMDEYVFYDGPPFATGLPHFGHFVPGTIKDIIPRYQTMKGRKVERRFGWDCHGLPVEYEMEKELRISGKKAIEEFGISKFNESCRSIVLRYTEQWRKIITRLGRWVDFDNDYKTMDPDYMESIWWVVKELWMKDLLKQGFYIMPYCPRCSTVLSNFELNLGGYKDIHDPSITVKFRLNENEDKNKDENKNKKAQNTYILAWTTTPWTLPSNLALGIGRDIDYVKVRDGDEFYILARERLPYYYKVKNESAANPNSKHNSEPNSNTELPEHKYEIVDEFKGSEFEGKSYEPLFPYFKNCKESGAFRTVLGDFVSTQDGTGIVHIAPGFGEDDYNVLKNTGIPTVCPVDEEGKFTSEVSDYKGIFVKNADKQIIKDLKEQGKLVKRENYLHSYPHCWRCKSPLIYRAISSWFVNIDKIKEKMLKANRQIYWVPGHLKDGRFGKWLEGARNWAISRNRFWGNPIPIWKCSLCDKMVCIGSRKELEQKSGKTIKDLHKHFIDNITFSCDCGGEMKRISDVLDCWFESGSMPYAQNHYPFENKKHFESHFPADFISEGLDQTRGWFYTLTVLAAALFDKPAFKKVIVNGLVLSEDGKKMSKSERNYTDPVKVINNFGADSLRIFLINSSVVKGEDLKYSDDGVKDVLKNIIIPLWNAYSFFVTYANIDKIKPVSAPENPENPLDRWILSEVERMVEGVTEQMELYDLQKAAAHFAEFIDLLNNWYIRRSRRRFWRSENDMDKMQAYQTLYTVLIKLILVASPFIPFITEEIYQNLKTEKSPQSIHLCDYPEAKTGTREQELEMKMKITRQAVSMGRALRALHNLKIRQPLKAIYLVTKNQKERKALIEMEGIIREELNVKEVIFRENEEDLVEYNAQPNYRVLGKILGKDMKSAAEKIKSLSLKEIQSLMEGAVLSFDLEGNRSFDLTEEGINIIRNEKENLKILNEGSLTIALDPELTEELVQEGMVRDIVRSVQNLRKDKDLNVEDRIVLWIYGLENVKESVQKFEEYLASETLALSWNWEKKEDAVEAACGDNSCYISLAKVGAKLDE